MNGLCYAIRWWAGALACSALALLAVPAAPAGAQGLPYSFSADTPARAAEVNANFRYVAPENVYLVSPVAGGTAQDNGTALHATLDKIQTLSTAPSASTPYLVKLAPGVYDTQLAMVPYVDIEGSGEGMTTLTNSGTGLCATSGSEVNTVCAASHAGLRFLTVALPQNGQAVGVPSGTTGFRMTRVTVSAGGSAASSAAAGIGVEIGDAAPVLRDVTIDVADGSGTATSTTGVDIVSTQAVQPVLDGVTISVSGSSDNTGIATSGPARPIVRNTVVNVSGGLDTSANGVSVVNGSAELRNVAVDAEATMTQLNITNFGTSTVPSGMGLSFNGSSNLGTTIDRSTIQGGGNSVFINAGASYVVDIGVSKLVGTLDDASGGSSTVRCFAVYSQLMTNGAGTPGLTACP